jgi:glycosyltransferase involved in cell wall biosynthesis
MGFPVLDPEAARANFGFNVSGYVTGSFGLGVAVRNTLRAMDRRGDRFMFLDIELPDGRSGQDLTCVSLGERSNEFAPFAVNIFHFNPADVYEVLRRGQLAFVSRFNVCVPFWELSHLPKSWLPVIGGMDVVLAPTRFIQDAIHRSCPGVLCLHYPQAPLVSAGVEPDRSRWGLPKEALVFLASFDLLSDVERKNPWAAIEAFCQAFPQPGNQYLVLKMNRSTLSNSYFTEAVERIQGLVEAHPNIVLIDESLPYADVLRLYASCDILVSMHRSEGLGLHLMECMSQGKVVIATAWSGNMDFLTEDNSCLVGYELVDVVSSQYEYTRPTVGGVQKWADPSVSQCADQMVRLAGDPILRQKLGSRAAEDMRVRNEDFLRGEVWDRLADMVRDTDSSLWRHHRDRIDWLVNYSG